MSCWWKFSSCACWGTFASQGPCPMYLSRNREVLLRWFALHCNSQARLCHLHSLGVWIASMNEEIFACFSLTFLACAPNFWITNPVEHLKEESRIQEACLFFSCVLCCGCLSELCDSGRMFFFAMCCGSCLLPESPWEVSKSLQASLFRRSPVSYLSNLP